MSNKTKALEFVTAFVASVPAPEDKKAALIAKAEELSDEWYDAMNPIYRLNLHSTKKADTEFLGQHITQLVIKA